MTEKTTTTSNADLMQTHHGNRPEDLPDSAPGKPVHKSEEPEPAPAAAPDTALAPDTRTNLDKIFGTERGSRMQRYDDHPAAETDRDEPWIIRDRWQSEGMARLLGDVQMFHQACSIPSSDQPVIPPDDRKALRVTLIDEEVNKELLPALLADDLVKIADGIGDAIVVLLGTALEYGIPIALVWTIIRRSNMSKVDPHTGKVRRRADGKILKPEGFVSPDILIAQVMGLAPPS